MLDFANVDKHQNISVCCDRLQLLKLSFRAFSPCTIFGVQRFYSIKTIAFTQCLHWLVVSGSVTLNLGQPKLIFITELFVLAWTGSCFCGQSTVCFSRSPEHELTLQVGVGNSGAFPLLMV